MAGYKHGTFSEVGEWVAVSKTEEVKCIRCDYCGFVGPFIGIDSKGKGACFGACGHGKVKRPPENKRKR